jgi:protein-S-isoprenylcysteine O-methyltransferase Ste14
VLLMLGAFGTAGIAGTGARTALPPLARGVLIATAVIWLAAELRQGMNHRDEGRWADGGSRSVIRIATVVGVILAIVTSHVAPSANFPSEGVSVWIGLATLWCGIGLRLWSFRTLGRYFTFTVQTSADQPVITDGPYRFLRHPSYTGVLLAVVGLGIVIGNWLSLVCLTTAVGCGIVYRIRVEEAALVDELGDRYLAYATTRKRLVPYVW